MVVVVGVVDVVGVVVRVVIGVVVVVAVVVAVDVSVVIWQSANEPAAYWSSHTRPCSPRLTRFTQELDESSPPDGYY